MTANLSNIKIMSASNFANVSTTSNDTLYFVEEGKINVLATSGTIALTDNSINSITPSAAVTFTLPSVDTTNFHQILVQINMTSVKTITLGTTHYFNKTAPSMSTTGTYNLIYEYDKAKGYWIVGCIAKS